MPFWVDCQRAAETSYENSPEWNSEPQNNEYRTAEFRRMVSLRSVFFIKKIEYLPSTFDIRHSLFDIRYSLFLKVSYSIRPAVVLAGGWADTRNLIKVEVH
jgi:hypothetical protein